MLLFLDNIPPLYSYDGHILLNGYPFLDSKVDYNHDALVCDVMSPKQGESPLTIVDLSNCTIGIIATPLCTCTLATPPCACAVATPPCAVATPPYTCTIVCVLVYVEVHLNLY